MITQRGLHRDDVPAHTALLADAEKVDQTGEHYSEADILEEYDNPDIEVGEDIVGVFDGDELIAYFSVYPRAAAGMPLKMHVEGVVRPSRRGEGIGTDLVTAMLARADAVHAEREPMNSARYVLVGLSSNSEQESLLTAAGFRAERWNFSMRAQLADLDLDAPPVFPAGHTLVTYSAGIDQAMREAHNEAFLDHPDFTPWNEVMWRQWVSSSHNFRPALSIALVADEDPDRVVAYVQNNEYEAHFAATGRREAYVGRVGTRRELRGRGVAGAMLRESLRRFRAAGYDEASLDVDSQNPTGALGVYERAGFVVERRFTNYALGRPPVTTAG